MKKNYGKGRGQGEASNRSKKGSGPRDTGEDGLVALGVRWLRRAALDIGRQRRFAIGVGVGARGECEFDRSVFAEGCDFRVGGREAQLQAGAKLSAGADQCEKAIRRRAGAEQQRLGLA